jgi:pimeloyl-ACP methyl ester carboxylesterase
MRLTLGTTHNYLEVTQTIPQGGSDTVVIFMHGFMSTQTGEKASQFRELLVSRGITYITFDFRGHGQSSGTMRALTGTHLLEDCHAVIEQCCAPHHRIILIGSSMGGWVASWYAAQHPERISAIMLIAPSFVIGQWILKNLTPEQVTAWAESGVLAFSNEYGHVELGYGFVQDMEHYPVTELYRCYRTPTLICHGMNDDIVDYRQSLNFQQHCASTDVDLVLLKNGDHRLTAHKAELGTWLLMYLEHRWMKLAV